MKTDRILRSVPDLAGAAAALVLVLGAAAASAQYSRYAEVVKAVGAKID